ncbi:MAG: hypothetical protein HOZ81_20390 [Streptomyces sp.]|nr:hypothetical protein [Streptomyces sp.]NUS89397.1 hypothetical protein [Streptomyces sp.]
MNVTIRQIAVSGSAAAALLGGAAVITTATAPPASAAEQTVAHRAVTAPVRLPDGRTMRITGMGGYGHQATAAHIATVAAYKTDADPSTSPDLSTGITPGGGAQVQPPTNGQQTGYNQQQISTQAGGGVVAVGIVSILLLGIIVWFKVKHGGLKAADAALGVVAGVAVGGTFLGPMISNMTNSLVGSIGSALSSLG